MSRHNNISVLVAAITVLFVIVGFAIYFNNPGLNKAWSIQQKDKGMVGLGVHSPEFTFEKNYSNVKAAVQRGMMTYPAIAATTAENHTVTTIKINRTQLQQINESQFKKADL
jgi:hypothetical protein